jgi:anti-anti-sigma factor
MDVSPLSERLVRVTLTGRLDTAGVDGVETRFLASLVPGAKNAIVDLSQVDFVASMGIRMLMSAARSLKSRRAALAIYGAQDRVKQVFDIVSLGQIIPVCSTEEEALAAIAPAGD